MGNQDDLGFPSDETEEQKKVKKIKQLMRVVCICKGINLKSVIRGLANSTTVEQVNAKVGTGSGGCCGERCRPRIQILLDKKKMAEEKKRNS